jgi:hypothetical protein
MDLKPPFGPTWRGKVNLSCAAPSWPVLGKNSTYSAAQFPTTSTDIALMSKKIIAHYPQ